MTIQKQILDLLMDLQAEHGMALILITHDMGVVAETADRVIVQYNGRKMEEADVLSLFETPQNPYTRALLSALPENATGDRLPTVADFIRRRRRRNDAPVARSPRPHPRLSSSRRHVRRRAGPCARVKGIDFTVERGKTLAIVGESGCGKSTLARIITLIDPPIGRRAADRGQGGRHRARRR